LNHSPKSRYTGSKPKRKQGQEEAWIKKERRDGKQKETYMHRKPTPLCIEVYNKEKKRGLLNDSTNDKEIFR